MKFGLLPGTITQDFQPCHHIHQVPLHNICQRFRSHDFTRIPFFNTTHHFVYMYFLYIGERSHANQMFSTIIAIPPQGHNAAITAIKQRPSQSLADNRQEPPITNDLWLTYHRSHIRRTVQMHISNTICINKSGHTQPQQEQRIKATKPEVNSHK